VNRTAVAALALCLAAPAAPAYGHGGGLNQDGCHRETATGGYHCHRGSSSGDPDWGAAAAVLGGLAVVGVAIWWWNKQRTAQALSDFAPPIKRRNTGLHYAIDEAGIPSIGVFWKIPF